MKGEERRERVLTFLKESKEPIKGSDLSARLNVTRQVVVQDIALLRAEGSDIIATPQGYILLSGVHSGIRRVIAVRHAEEDIEDELKSIIALGGRVLDVTIEHKIYGELTGKLMLKSLYDLEVFMDKLKEGEVKPLSQLTGGVHLHTIEAEDEKVMEKILERLREKQYLISQEG